MGETENNNPFVLNTSMDPNVFAESVPERSRGKCISISDRWGSRAKNTYIGDAKIHDENFAFLSSTLAKLHKELYEPLYYVTWQDDVPYETGGGFVDYVEYMTVNWAGIMNEHRNVVGNGVNYIPRVNAGLKQHRVNVYTYEVAYDLRFIELEKMKKVPLQKSIKEIYNNAIVAGWDMFVQQVAYTGIDSTTGLFNSDDKVLVTEIDNNGTTGEGFEGLDDAVVVSFFNGIFESYLSESNMNINILPDTIRVPSFVLSDLTSRFSSLYTSSLYEYVLEHNLGKAQDKKLDITIEGRPILNDMGTNGCGRIVAYRKHKNFVRIDIPYPMQHYITQPNIERMCYTSAFVGQVSTIQLPYNESSAEPGVVTYWDFTSKVE